MGSALLNTADELEVAAPEEAVTPALRTQVAERLAAHRSRRGTVHGQPLAEPVRPVAAGRSARIAAAVAERYARTPTYREVLAAEAERAIQQARAAAEVAAQNAQAIAAAQQRMLEAYDEHARREAAARLELSRAEVLSAAPRPNDFIEKHEDLKAPAATDQELWPDLAISATSTTAGTARSTKRARRAEPRTASAGDDPVDSHAGATVPASPAGGLTVRLYQQEAEFGNVLSARTAAVAARNRPGGDRRSSEEHSGYGRDKNEAEAMALDDEIAFRQAPVFEEPAGPPVALPANLIEFPRQLVAARKSRPRYAEGPLRDEIMSAPVDGQLRIFEVDPAQISTSPDDAERQTAQWTSLWLEAPAQPGGAEAAEHEADPQMIAAFAGAVATPQPASLWRRASACAINLALAMGALLVFAAVSVTIAGNGVAEPLSARLAQAGAEWRTIATIAGVSGTFLLLLYHGLFSWFSTASPGMRCVRIALCTFEDGNPTRRDVRRRLAATVLSAVSLGMGYAWAALDEERLTWHDRISGMYLRRY